MNPGRAYSRDLGKVLPAKAGVPAGTPALAGSTLQTQWPSSRECAQPRLRKIFAACLFGAWLSAPFLLCTAEPASNFRRPKNEAELRYWLENMVSYLAHTHVPTVWTKQGIELEPLEWNQKPDGSLESERKLPNGISFGARVKSTPDSVRMALWLKKEVYEGTDIENEFRRIDKLDWRNDAR
jgi:hypothetical protein